MKDFLKSALGAVLGAGLVIGLIGGASIALADRVTTGGGTVSSIAVSGGTTGLTVSGSPVTTSGTITIAGRLSVTNGGTNGTGFSTNQIDYFNGTSLVSASSTAVNNGAGWFGIGTTTPHWSLQIASSTAPQLVLSDGSATASHWSLRNSGGTLTISTSSPTTFATSTTPALTLTNNGQVSTAELSVGTSTNMTVDWNTTPNQVLIRAGTSAFTIAFNNASTSGMTKRIIVCNPGSSAGALTWNAPIEWAAATIPTQTTTASQCDAYSFIVSSATSTVKVFGAGSTGFN